MTAAPVSVVVAAWSGSSSLSRCLESLPIAEAEIIVATDRTREELAKVESAFPTVRFIFAHPPVTVFKLRALGVAQARGKLIALIEDHVTASTEWMETLEIAHANGALIVGGPIDNGLVTTTYDWALYFAEYGIYMPPVLRGPTEMLSGLNAAYDADLLRDYRDLWKEEFYETDVHAALKKAGHLFEMEPAAVVRSHIKMSLREAMDHLFRGGKHFGAFRKSHSSPAAAVCWLCVSPLIPFVLVARIFADVARKQPGRLKHVVLSLPFLALLLGAWGAGEAAGYLGVARSNESYAHRH